ncbi:MAG TPA: sulfate adenylyltransferase subunit CysN [Bryobacteraceae bacterium]|nr:sulfate adenylyltransferase subunit CysN [Bryobacteraceae bacterium]
MTVVETNSSALSIEEFLAQEMNKELLRFSTAGSVDDGKSTLIGRLLYDARGIYEDQLDSIQKSKVNRSSGPIDFSLLTDGLKAEREQGITIDVAYRYFSTPRRKFIIADTPGHEQYTRNMATGASTAQLAIVLVDARNGVLSQTRRHATISSLLGIPHIVLAINKMDLMGYSEEVYNQIRDEFLHFTKDFGFEDILPIPISALEGENVARRATRMPWYDGPALLEYLEQVPVSVNVESRPLRFAVQYVIRPDQFFRGYAGQIASGTLRVGDTVMALPSGKSSRIASITTFDGDLQAAHSPMSVTLTLEDERDISRGDMLVHPQSLPQAARQFEAHLVWMTEDPLAAGRSLLLKHTSQQVTARVHSIESRLDIQTMERKPAAALSLNDIGIVRIDASRPVFFDPYRENRLTGAFILIDPLTNGTVAAGMMLRAIERKSLNSGHVTAEERYTRNGHGPALLVLQDSSLALRLERRLFDHGCQVLAMNPGIHAAALYAAGVILIAAAIEDPRAIKLDSLPLPKDEEAAVDAIMAYLEQREVLVSDRFSSGEGI